jgi:hypothetical protein
MREPARRARRTIATATVVALIAGVALVASIGPGAGPPEADRAADPAAACQDLRAGAMVACPHGNDAPPQGVSLYERPTLKEIEARSSLRSPNARLRGLAGLEQATAASGPGADPASVSCIGNGTSGNRIQAIYAHALDKPDHYDSVVTSLRAWMAQADQAVWTSAGQTGGGKRLRFVTTSDCQLDVARVTLTALGDDSFSQMRIELIAQGFTRTDRKYLVWVDAAVGICGLGEVYADTSPGPENRNNRGPSYARVDTPCWQYAELHEIFHNLGAVQRDTPHPSAVWHCTDEADVLCYDDDGSGPVVMTTPCPPEQEALLDCGDDDYFNTSPPAGNYLATHWNTANSSFLQDDDAPLPAQLSLTGAATITYGDQATLGSRLTDERTTAGIAGDKVNLFARRAGTAGELGSGTATTATDGAATFTPTPAATTTYRASFPGSDTYGTATSAPVTVTVRPTVTAHPTDSTVTAGETVTVTGRVAPNHHGQGVYLQRLVNGAWKRVASTRLSRASTYALKVKPPSRGTFSYRVGKRADTDHASATSPTLRVTVR